MAQPSEQESHLRGRDAAWVAMVRMRQACGSGVLDLMAAGVGMDFWGWVHAGTGFCGHKALGAGVTPLCARFVSAPGVGWVV